MRLHKTKEINNMKKTLIIIFLALSIVSQGQTFSSLLKDRTKVFNVKDYRAVGDSTTDDQTAVQNAINAAYSAGGGTVYLPKGAYNVTGLHSYSNVNITGDDAKIVAASTISYDYILHLEGSLISNTTLTANGTLGASSVSVTSSAAFAAGDYIVVSDSTFGNTTDALGKNQEFNRVLSVSSGTINLMNPLCGTYYSDSTARVYKYSPVRDVIIEGLHFDIPGASDAGGILLEYCYNVTVKGCKVTGMFYPGINIDKSANVHILDNIFMDGQDLSTGGRGYGFATYESSHNVLIKGNMTERVRENAVSNGSKHITVSDNIFRNSYDDGINTHGSGNRYVIISNNIIEGGCTAGGITIGGGKNNTDSDVLVSNNLITNLSKSGIVVNSTVASQPMVRITIRDNEIRAFGLDAASGIYARYMEESVIEGNVIRGNGDADQDYGIYVKLDTAVVVQNNVIDNISGEGIVYESCDDVHILGNSVTNITGSNYYYSETNGTIIFNGNISDGKGNLGAVTAGYNYFGSGWVTGLPE